VAPPGGDALLCNLLNMFIYTRTHTHTPTHTDRLCLYHLRRKTFVVINIVNAHHFHYKVDDLEPVLNYMGAGVCFSYTCAQSLFSEREKTPPLSQCQSVQIMN